MLFSLNVLNEQPRDRCRQRRLPCLKRQFNLDPRLVLTPIPGKFEHPIESVPELRERGGKILSLLRRLARYRNLLFSPKGIVQTHRARLHWAFSNAVEMGFTSRSRALTTTALYSNGTWLMMLPVLFAGGTLV